MPTSTVENYLKQIYLEQRQDTDHLVPMGQLAEKMGVAPGTATAMVKALAGARLVDYTPRDGVRLSDEGTRLALQVLRRHRLVELFLVKVLHLDWSEVHAEAEELEHAISDKVLARIDELLGHPEADPHGDPIPPAHGSPRRLELIPLDQCRPGQSVRIARVRDQDPEFLQFAERHGLTPGVEAIVEANTPSADAITLRPGDADAVTMGTKAASKILVAAAEG